ncbi:hypothetical protein B0533_08985 [Sedimentibacter sp. SX930]|nr:hypothetical protein B0533_08985 [Sedimentibacter sp. SX930]
MDLYHFICTCLLVFFLVFFYVTILFESGFHDHGKLPKKGAGFLCTLPKALSGCGKLLEKPQKLVMKKSQFIAIVCIALAPKALRKGKRTTKP